MVMVVVVVVVSVVVVLVVVVVVFCHGLCTKFYNINAFTVVVVVVVVSMTVVVVVVVVLTTAITFGIVTLDPILVTALGLEKRFPRILREKVKCDFIRPKSPYDSTRVRMVLMVDTRLYKNYLRLYCYLCLVRHVTVMLV